MNTIQTEKKWFICPYCGSKIIIYDNTANSRGVFTVCHRGCKREVEIVVQNGEQVFPQHSNR